MTLAEIRSMEKDWLTPAEVGEVLGCDPQGIRVSAWQDRERLGFPVIIIGHRVKIPREGFIRFMEGRGQA